MTILIETTAWILSATSLYCVYRQGNGGKWGWALGFINTLLWIGYTVATEQWGLVPLNIAMAIINLRNYFKNDGAKLGIPQKNKVLRKPWQAVIRQARRADGEESSRERERATLTDLQLSSVPRVAPDTRGSV